MKIAIMGTRGVPPRYGGFETFAAELGTRLVARGHEVTVYCRSVGSSGSSEFLGVPRDGTSVRGTPADLPGAPAPGRPGRRDAPDKRRDRGTEEPRNWKGIERIVLPAIRHKYLETVSHTFLSALDALRRPFDVVLLCNAANAFVLPLLRAARFPVAINVDGIERRRRKWNILGRAVYAIGETFSVTFATRIVADADVIADYYRSEFGAETVMIPYGAEFPSEENSDVLRRLGIESDRYILYVSRFEPENNPLEVVQAYERSGVDVPLVMVGDASYAHELKRELLRHQSPRVIFPGALYGLDYRTLQRNARLYLQATEVGGTHPALVEAMASGGRVLAHDTPENREVGGDSIGYFELRPVETLSGMLRECVANPPSREAARRRAATRYGWDEVTARYERLFFEIA